MVGDWSSFSTCVWPKMARIRSAPACKDWKRYDTGESISEALATSLGVGSDRYFAMLCAGFVEIDAQGQDVYDYQPKLVRFYRKCEPLVLQ